jgi:hypothetical protein
MALSHLLEFASFSILHYGQLTIINGHCPEANQSEHIYSNFYNPANQLCSLFDLRSE